MPAAAPIALLPSTTISASGIGTAVHSLKRYAGLFGSMAVSAVPSGGNPSLDVFLQGTPDGGTTWQDVAHYLFGGLIETRVFQITQYVTGGDQVQLLSAEADEVVIPSHTSMQAPSDGQLSVGSVMQGPFGDQLRVKYVFAANGSTGSYTLSVNAMPVGGP